MPTHVAPMQDLPLLIHAEREIQRDESYNWINLSRQTGTLVLQRTVSGGAFLEQGGIRVPVPAGRAMLFEWGEDSSYGIGPADKRPYVLEYLTMKPSGGIGALARQIRRDFGSVLLMQDNLEAARILHQIVADYAGGLKRDRLELAELLYRLLLAIYREQLAGSLHQDPVGYGHHLICNRYRSPIHLKELVAQLGMSREHFTRVFSSRYGESPAAMLRRLRLEHARLLARTSTMPVEDLAPACGFASVQTFRRAYRLHFGHPVGRERQA